MIPGSASSHLLGAPASAGTLFTRSLRFNTADSTYLNRTPASAGNQTTWTWAAWVKRGSVVGNNETIFGSSDSTAQNYDILRWSGEALVYDSIKSGLTAASIQLTPLFRDPTAWFHIVLAYDSTQATAANRIKLYVNGNQVTAFALATYPTQNNTTARINTTNNHTIGRFGDWTTAWHLSGYLTGIHFIDGQALAASSFGEFDTNGIWQPKAYTGSYGTNGFKLDFADNSNTTAATLGKDTSGNGNNFTPNNFSVTAGAGNDSLTDSPSNNFATLNPLDGSPTGLSNGNLDATTANAYPTIVPGSGQWYYEVDGTGYTWNGVRANFTPRAGSHNFGQRPFAGTPTSGYVALCTANLPTPTIVKPSTAFDTVLYTGTGASLTPTSSLGFSPDLVWIKGRSGATDHGIYDTVRGATFDIASNLVTAQTTQAQGVTAFNSNGFTVGTLAKLNTNTATYAAWCWDAGSSNATNTSGTITSTVRANTTAGFSVLTYTGNGTAGATIGHGLGVAPQMIMIKSTSAGNPWNIYTTAIDGSLDFFVFANTAKSDSAQSVPTSSVFSVSAGINVNGNTETYVAYAWAPVTGFSAFGVYTGNGSTDGPFVHTGFRPAVVLVKMSSSTGDWTILDDKRLGYNVDNNPLYPGLANAEGTTDLIDITSNGFKVRTTDATFNTNTGVYFYAAWASAPFASARAR